MQTLEVGGGKVSQNGAITRFAIPPTTTRAYANAQWDNYHGLQRSHFPNRPLTQMHLRARFSHEVTQLAGTAGFGFWNNPFSLFGGGVLASPNTCWFFAGSPPNDQYLCEGVPGWGWKVATLNTGRRPPLLVAPLAVPAILLTRVPGLGKPIMRLARRLVKAHERLLDVKMTEWHTYELTWETKQATFAVDGVEVFRSPAPPEMPLGFVLWIDNQYAVASERGDFKFGLVAQAEERWMEVEGLEGVRG